jgi:hypothetical protein
MERAPTVEQVERKLAARLDGARVRRVLVGSAVVTLLLYFIPFGRWLAYPLMLLSTLVHELGHGVAAELVGGEFRQFVMFADGSGAASSAGVAPGIRDAVVSAGGLVGPALMAGLCFVFVRGPKRSRFMVGALGLALLAAEILVVRNAFGLVFVGLVTAALLFVAIKRDGEEAQVVLAFVAVQLAVSVFSRGDYLFTEVAKTSLGDMPSDVAQMASALGGPYWLWGGVCGGLSVLVLGLGLWWALRSPGRKKAA